MTATSLPDPRRAAGTVPWYLALPAAAASGLLLYLAFPSIGIGVLVVPAIALQLIALRGRRLGMAFIVGLLSGLVFYLPTVSWTSKFLGDAALGWVPWLALCLLESLLYGAGAMVIALAIRTVARLTARPVLRAAFTALSVAAIWTTREAVISTWPWGGFGWGRIGVALADLPVARVASWVGVSGLTFICVLVVAGAVEAAVFDRARALRVPRIVAAAVTVGIAVTAVILPQFPTSVVGSTRIAAVQGNGPTAYVDQRERYEVLRDQRDATEPAVGADVDLVLWPEGGVDADPLRDAAAAAVLDDVVADTGAPLLMNGVSANGADIADPNVPIYNLSMLWTASGPTDRYAKRHPVPFGEYVPERPIFEAIAPSLIGLITREYTPGTQSPVFDINGMRAGLAICFDAIADDVIREGITDGAQIFLFQTNNSDFRGTDENVQQLQIARMRAIETGRTVVNLSTSGTTSMIRADGSTVAEIGVDRTGILIEELPLREGVTAGVLLGPWVEGLLALSVPMVLVGAVVARRRPTALGSVA